MNDLPPLPPNADVRAITERVNRLIREFNRSDRAAPILGEDIGTATAFAINPVPGITTYEVGQEFVFQAAHTNTTGTPTFEVNGLGAGPVTLPTGATLPVGAIVAGGTTRIVVASTAPTFHLASGQGMTAGSSDVLTNKTFDTAGAGNIFKINGYQVTDKTGTGKVVLDTAPTIVSPTIGTGITLPDGIVVSRSGWQKLIADQVVSGAGQISITGLPANVKNLMLLWRFLPGTNGVGFLFQVYDSGGALVTSNLYNNLGSYVANNGTGAVFAGTNSSAFGLTGPISQANSVLPTSGVIVIPDVKSATFGNQMAVQHWAYAYNGANAFSYYGSGLIPNNISGIRIAPTAGVFSGRFSLLGAFD